MSAQEPAPACRVSAVAAAATKNAELRTLSRSAARLTLCPSPLAYRVVEGWRGP
ncbi:hypothetical protein [Streptomyces sp. NPDC006134]|uniref:hypothetical protein n=1 Tax=Streptomyces sp. NPDC006134 TaxID=3154467 RepID=UPI003408A9F1